MFRPTARGLGAALSLAAAPTFALMALLTPALDGASGTLCRAAPDASPLAGMALMYGFMAVFHMAPWLRLVRGRRPISQPRRART